MSVLTDLIAAWHAANPGFLTSGEATARTSPDAGTVDASAPCAQTRAVVEPGLRRGRRQTDAARMRQGASRLGISYRKYRDHVTRGDRWCSGHGRWHRAGVVFASGPRGSYCRAWKRAYDRERHHRVTLVMGAAS